MDDAAAYADAYNKALALLARREYSRRDLARRLDARGLPADAINAALDRLIEQGFQNDERFAGAFARTRAAAGYGPVRIRAELFGDGVADEMIEAALESCETDWPELAQELAQRRFAGNNPADAATQRKLIGFLLRRGFTQSDAYAALRSLSGREDSV
ncbi:MAG: recombination regulator RecX [Gammaproteobacteria bacterium HGW-Gammaproteobacteria-5]|jgi:regulatory protein|nr:MAG: recombination regulator RecX [Gammaproteobacteria bacterium HGW-Gammaproteobacteria-5]